MKSRPLPPVSDHAVLRYLEREHGVPVEDIRALIASSAAVGVAHQAPAVCLDKVKLVIRDGIVVTVLKREWHRRVRPSRRRQDQ